jgi:hypothetical protein
MVVLHARWTGMDAQELNWWVNRTIHRDELRFLHPGFQHHMWPGSQRVRKIFCMLSSSAAESAAYLTKLDFRGPAQIRGHNSPIGIQIH